MLFIINIILAMLMALTPPIFSMNGDEKSNDDKKSIEEIFGNKKPENSNANNRNREKTPPSEEQEALEKQKSPGKRTIDKVENVQFSPEKKVKSELLKTGLTPLLKKATITREKIDISDDIYDDTSDAKIKFYLKKLDTEEEEEEEEEYDNYEDYDKGENYATEEEYEEEEEEEEEDLSIKAQINDIEEILNDKKLEQELISSSDFGKNENCDTENFFLMEKVAKIESTINEIGTIKDLYSQCKDAIKVIVKNIGKDDIWKKIAKKFHTKLVELSKAKENNIFTKNNTIYIKHEEAENYFLEDNHASELFILLNHREKKPATFVTTNITHIINITWDKDKNFGGGHFLDSNDNTQKVIGSKRYPKSKFYQIGENKNGLKLGYWKMKTDTIDEETGKPYPNNYKISTLFPEDKSVDDIMPDMHKVFEISKKRNQGNGIFLLSDGIHCLISCDTNLNKIITYFPIFVLDDITIDLNADYSDDEEEVSFTAFNFSSNDNGNTNQKIKPINRIFKTTHLKMQQNILNNPSKKPIQTVISIDNPKKDGFTYIVDYVGCVYVKVIPKK